MKIAAFNSKIIALPITILFFLGMFFIGTPLTAQTEIPGLTPITLPTAKPKKNEPPVKSKENLEQLGNQYYRDQQWEKAASIYLELYEMTPRLHYYYYYYNCMIYLNDTENLEKFVKKVAAKNAGNLMYEVDLGYLYTFRGDSKKGTKKYEETLNALDKNPQQVASVASAFRNKLAFDYAIKAYQKGRQLSKNPTQYALDLAYMYSVDGNYIEMSEECIKLAIAKPEQINNVKNNLQNYINNDKEGLRHNALKKTLLKYAQKEPDKSEPQEMLIWLAMQDKDFPLAYTWASALDARYREDGKRLMELGNIALSNEDYETATNAYQYLVNKGSANPYYLDARINLLNAKFLKITHYPNYDNKELESLGDDYLLIFNELGKNKNTVQLMKNYAHLLAFHLNRKDDAVTILNEAINIPYAKPDIIAQCKLELGDIYVFTGEVWDALLLYSQVDKAFKNDPIGFEAKYRNAKLSFYIGEFEWAKTQLNVLKAATSKFIANDALELSLTISDNMEMDSSYSGLKLYAAADLLFAQQKYDEAWNMLDSIPLLALFHPLNDRAILKKAEIAIKQYHYTTADSLLNYLVETYPNGILADNALFMRGELNEKILNNNEVAKECYKSLMIDYPGSLFTAEGRKRFRILRGEAPENLEQKSLERQFFEEERPAF